jgi:hypothetical protein
MTVRRENIIVPHGRPIRTEFFRIQRHIVVVFRIPLDRFSDLER